MQTDSDELLAHLLDELLQSVRSGAQPDVESVARRHPELADELRALWTTADVFEDLAGAAQLEDSANGLDSESGGTISPGSSGGPLPRRLGDYELLSELGRGGMGIVYKARHLPLNRVVALKMILRGEFASTDDIERFSKEALAAARLEHPHIVSVYEVGRYQDQPFFSMQFVEGSTLADRIAQGPVPAREAAELLIPVCRAIAAAHRAGILHRDLKPSNILLDNNNRPLVTDFGLAKHLPSANERDQANAPTVTDITRSGAILGTPGYIAPEQAATDIFSLGAILYAMLTGRAPFHAASPIDTVLLVLEQDPPPPRLINPKADPDLELIAMKALQKPSDLRYASADSLADDLQAYLRNEPISARSSHLFQVISRAFRPTHYVSVLQNWGLLWMWHAVVLLILCLTTNGMQLMAIDSRWPYVGLWTAGLSTWGVIFWNLRRRAGPVTFVERQIAHVWAASIASSTTLFAVEATLDLPVLSLSPVLAVIAASVFVAKAGILSGEFYVHAAVLYLTSIPMAWLQHEGWDYSLVLFGIVAAGTFLIPGWKFHRQRLRAEDSRRITAQPISSASE
ncbi:MAG: serine/threonine protein kinase [Planctomycetota bacterium]|nr:MAG: serine/threonine protein kinase [Planctomycetota bacterium]